MRISRNLHTRVAIKNNYTQRVQLEQKCQSELVEDIKKDTFRQAQCDNLV